MGYTGIITDGMLRCMGDELRKPMGKAGWTAEECSESNAVKLERILQKQISNWLRLHSVAFISSRMDKRTRNTKGCPDFLFAIRGQATAVEAKRPGGTLRPDQERMRLELMRDGWRHLTAYRLEDVIDLFKTSERIWKIYPRDAS